MGSQTRSAALVLTTVVLSCGPLATADQAQTPAPSPEDLQRALQRRYDLVVDFSADFTHTYEGGLLRTALVEHGTVLVKKPGRMRWNYEEPEQKLYVSDGERLYFYLPEDRQVIIGRLPDTNEATMPALFLAGAGDFAADFTAAYDAVADAPPNSHVLRLTPTKSERNFEFLTLVIDTRSLAIRRLVAYDLQGGISTFFFSNLQENVGLSDRPFTFEIPRGTDVIDSTQSERFR